MGKKARKEQEDTGLGGEQKRLLGLLLLAFKFFPYYYFVKVTNLLIFNGEIPGIGNLRRSRLVKKP